MPTYIVEKREVWTQMVEIEAKDEEEAKLLVSRGQGHMLDETLEYSHDLATDNWTIEPLELVEPIELLGCDRCDAFEDGKCRYHVEAAGPGHRCLEWSERADCGKGLS